MNDIVFKDRLVLDLGLYIFRFKGMFFCCRRLVFVGVFVIRVKNFIFVIGLVVSCLRLLNWGFVGCVSKVLILIFLN